jgi:hypothetical protein
MIHINLDKLYWREENYLLWGSFVIAVMMDGELFFTHSYGSRLTDEERAYIRLKYL